MYLINFWITTNTHYHSLNRLRTFTALYIASPREMPSLRVDCALGQVISWTFDGAVSIWKALLVIRLANRNRLRTAQSPNSGLITTNRQKNKIWFENINLAQRKCDTKLQGSNLVMIMHKWRNDAPSFGEKQIIKASTKLNWTISLRTFCRQQRENVSYSIQHRQK